MSIQHFGTVEFKNGVYVKSAGSADWSVQPIEPVNVPVGQVHIQFHQPITLPYTVLVTAKRLANTPLIISNYGDVTENGFVVHLGETVADRTVINGDFSFMVL